MSKDVTCSVKTLNCKFVSLTTRSTTFEEMIMLEEMCADMRLVSEVIP